MPAHVRMLEELGEGESWESAVTKYLFNIRVMGVEKWANGKQVFAKGIATRNAHRYKWGITELPLSDGEYKIYTTNDLQPRLDEAIRFLHAVDKLLNDHENLKDAAIHDPLTGALNRKGLQDWFISRKQKYTDDIGFLLALIDLDNFKELNDTYGHQMGDEALVAISQALTQTLRSYDVVARLGGDEFVFILEMSACHPAVKGRLEEIVQSLPLDKYNLSLTIGTACYPDHGTELQTLLAKADALLYEGKSKGKNLIMIWKDGDSHDNDQT